MALNREQRAGDRPMELGRNRVLWNSLAGAEIGLLKWFPRGKGSTGPT